MFWSLYDRENTAHHDKQTAVWSNEQRVSEPQNSAQVRENSLKAWQPKKPFIDDSARASSIDHKISGTMTWESKAFLAPTWA